jgi:Family of unknown function (DUF1028)
MRKTILLLVVLLGLESSAFATWSVIAIDRSTKRVVMAAASCVDTTDDAMKTAIAVVVPGVGVAACQAAADNTHQNQMLVFRELQKGTDPKKIIEMLSVDPAFQSRQFGILDMQGRVASHSGLGNSFETLAVHGQVPGTEIFYQVQGNTIRSGAIAKAAKAFGEAKGAITDRVMAALETGDANGGDVRCSCPPPPADGSPQLPCDNKHAHVAFILMANPMDTNGESHNDGKYALYITVSQPSPDHPLGARSGESLNPVKTLRMRYDAWRKTMPANFK